MAASTVRLQVSSYSQLSFVVVQKTLGQRGQVSRTLIGPLRLHIYDVDYKASNNHPYSVVHHDDKPLVVRFLSQAPKAIECRQCHTEFPRRKIVIPLDIILSLEEKWMYPDPNDQGEKLSSTRCTTKFYCI